MDRGVIWSDYPPPLLVKKKDEWLSDVRFAVSGSVHKVVNNLSK
jgi:hypothetical protein